MPENLSLSGTTVTMFGDRDALGRALSDELGRRGCNTHAISIPMGWLTSTTHAVMRLDTPAGELALRELLEVDNPPAHVIAVCESPLAAVHSDRLDALCRRCGANHDIALIWHPPLDVPLDDTPGADPSTQVLPPVGLAAAIADELVEQHSPTHGAVSFSSRTYDGLHN